LFFSCLGFCPRFNIFFNKKKSFWALSSFVLSMMRRIQFLVGYLHLIRIIDSKSEIEGENYCKVIEIASNCVALVDERTNLQYVY
jgi:hypothetical protein